MTPVSHERRRSFFFCALALWCLGALWACSPLRPTPSPVPASPTHSARPTPTPSPSRTPPPGASSTPIPSLGYFLPLVGKAKSTPLAVAVHPSPPPTEAPPPTPAWPDPLTGQTASKLGLHVISNNDPYIMEFVRRVHPRVVKALGDVGFLSDVKAASPDTVTIGRFDGQEETWVGTADPAAAAEVYVAANLDRYQRNPGVDYWEGWNEFVVNTPARMNWYAQFEATRACVLQAYGLRAAVGGFGVGWPNTYEDMALFLPALEAAHRCGGIFTLHEYNSPTLQCGVSVNVPNVIPGAPPFPDLAVGYRTLRYRFWYEGYLKPRGLGDLPLVISELGIEGGQATGGPCNDPGGRGWKTYQDWWVQRGLGSDGPQAYLNNLAWYDAEMQKDSYVIGATIFTTSAMDPGSGWNSFDLHDMMIPLAFYAVSQR